MAYSDKILDHYENPRNVGSLDKNDPNVGTGLVGSPACLSGDTLVAMADGRKYISIKQLAEENKDILIYSWNDKNHWVVAKGICPRKTRENVETVIVEFDDGSKINCTSDHELFKYSLNGRVTQKKIKVSDLKVGDCVRPFLRYELDGYYRVANSKTERFDDREHRMIAFFHYGNIDGKHVHHKNEIRNDNSLSNLEVLEPSIHNSEHMMGDDNPMRRFPEKNHFKNGFKGSANGRWINISNDKLVEVAYINFKDKNLTSQTWLKFAKENKLPQSPIARFGSWSNFKNLVNNFNHRVVSITSGPTQDVYCLTAPEFGNFAILNNITEKEHRGILVSNCGDVLKLQIKVSNDGIIEEVRWKTFGCGSAISASSLVSEMLKGKSLDEAIKLSNVEIVNELSLPPAKIHCSVLAEDSIKAAIKDYLKKKNK